MDDRHVNEVHLVMNDQRAMTVSVAELPGGDNVIYTAHLTRVVDRLSKVYSGFNSSDVSKSNPIQTKDYIVNKITCTISDRVSVNEVVVTNLKEEWNRTIIELKCNLHCLDGFKNEVCSDLKKHDAADDRMDLNTGRDCCAANFLYGLSKMKTKGNMDIDGFQTFLHKNGIRPSEIPRFVGNRWNLLFYMSGLVIKYQSKFFYYLFNWCKLKNSKARDNLKWGINNAHLLKQFRALGFISKVCTTPWMKLFYSNKDRLSNVAMVPHMKLFAANLDEYIANPKSLTTTTIDAFDDTIEVDDTLTALRVGDWCEEMDFLAGLILQAIHKVLHRQCERYAFCKNYFQKLLYHKTCLFI